MRMSEKAQTLAAYLLSAFAIGIWIQVAKEIFKIVRHTS